MTTTTEHIETPSDLDTLRRAANLIRSRANRASGSPWKASPVWSPDSAATSAVYSHAYPTGTAGSEVVASARRQTGKSGYGGIRNPHNAVHIAAFADPAVAFAVADLLDQAIDIWNKPISLPAVSPTDVDAVDFAGLTRSALSIARAYLVGEPR
ncbi:hypothetical protein ACFP2T_16310 [Plantactinospora solaniradicis]|uniref:Uncharacterized protein n=1 Tax=Plantactinospora solaniradicis TaxID=1723736 RepID=A0ABW1K8G5_9ACTN